MEVELLYDGTGNVGIYYNGRLQMMDAEPNLSVGAILGAAQVSFGVVTVSEPLDVWPYELEDLRA